MLDFKEKIDTFHCLAESFIIVENNKNDLYTWGWNEHGNLALGDKIDRH